MNYPNSVAVLRECMKNKTLVSFFQERQATLNHSLPLETYLLKPVQRILKYHLLLQELLKHFDKSDPGYEVVEDAIITMTAVAWYINDMKRKQEHAVRLQEIESLLMNWSGPDLSGFGELVLEGSFKVQRVKKERAFFLFDKMLLIAKKRLEQFIYSTHIFCCNLLLVETLKDPLCFKVSDQTIPKQQHVVQTKNQEEKRLWVHYLKRLIVENHPASLPQKARQVLGDNFCQSPQFDQDHLKKSSASSRFEDIHGYHRGRRQSGQEPPELLMYTPEKSRKSLPLLLEGNLPYRRTRRQSAPAKDIEAVFHPKALKQAGSEGELCPTESLGSAGSSSTLASSVIEVEAERAEAGLINKQRPNPEDEEEEEEEDLIPFSPPPTLSITEEILEFINQSRAREGLTAFHTNTTELDLPKDSQPSSNQTNFTCPLPPVAFPSSPDQRATTEQEQDRADMEKDIPLQSQTGRSGEEHELDIEKTIDEVVEASEETSPVEKGLEGDGETRGEVAEKAKEEVITRDESEEECTIIAPIQDLHASILTEEPPPLPKEEENNDATSSSQNPDVLHHPLQRRNPPTRGSHLTKRDKKIIEKIRSYYEAAAEAEEDLEEEEDEQGEGVDSRRRNSFSQIPSGLVKESVSRFDVTEHQGEPEAGPSIALETIEVINVESDRETEPCSPIGPMSPASALVADTDNDEQPTNSISSQDFNAEGPIQSATLSVMQDREAPDQVCLNQQSNPKRHDREAAEKQDKNEKSCKVTLEEAPEERHEEWETCVEATGEQGGNSLQGVGPSINKQYRSRDETTKTSAGHQSVMNGHEPKQAGQIEANGGHNDPSKPLTKTQSSWTRTKQEELTKNCGNLEGIPSQIKVGRWSRHSRIVTANRALFEGRASDIAGIGLFEASPVVDHVLMENSERILSKVQTLAKMYSVKANTMKVPLHQKRAIAVRNQLSVSSRLSGLSSQTKTKCQTQDVSQTQVQNPTGYWQQAKYQMEIREMDTHTDMKYRTQSHSEAKAQSKSITQPIYTKSQSQALTHCQNQSTTYSRCQKPTINQADQVIQEKKMIKRAQSLTTDSQEKGVAPCEPLLFGHVFVKEQLTPTLPQQTSGIILSRPRDFISALTKERDSIVGCISDDICQYSTTPGENASTLLRDQSSIQTQNNSYNSGSCSAERSSTASRYPHKTQPEDQSFSLCCSANNSPLKTPDCRATNCSTSSTGRGEVLKPNGEIERTDKREGSELNDGWPINSIIDGSTSVNIICNPVQSGPSLSDHYISQLGFSKEEKKQDKNKSNMPAADVLEYKFSMEHSDGKDILNKSVQSFHTGPEYLVCPRTEDEEEYPGQLVAVVASTQNQVLTDQGVVCGKAWTETVNLLEDCATTLGPSGGPKKDQNLTTQTELNEKICYLNDYSSQTRMTPQGSTITFTEQPHHHIYSGEVAVPPPLCQPLHKTSEPSHIFSHTLRETAEDHTAKGREAPNLWSLTHNPVSPPPCVQSFDSLPTFTSQRPPAQSTTLGDQAVSITRNVKNPSPYEHSFREPDQQSSRNPCCLPTSSVPSDSHSSFRPSLEISSQEERPYSGISTHGQDQNPTTTPSAFLPRHHSPSPVKALPTSTVSSVGATPCSSPFRVIPASSPIPLSHDDTSLNTFSRAPPCFSPTLPSGIGSSIQDPTSSSPAPSSAFTPSSSTSSSWRSSSIRAGPPPSPSSLRSPACSSPVSSSAFTRSLAASCISQSISQSLARKNTAMQQAPQINRVNQSPSSHLRQRSPSPKPPPSQQSSKDGYHHLRSPPSSPWSTCPSPSPMQSPPPPLSQHSPSQFMMPAHQQPPCPSSPSPRPSFLHAKIDSSKNANNNNNNNGGWTASSQKVPLANGSTNAKVMQQTHDPLSSASHNRVARPFSASEPSSRVQSPSPTPANSSFTRLCSPPPQHNYSSPIAHKPPRSTRVGDASSHNPLGLTLELPRASSSSSAFGQSATCLSPRILSPPPIGVSVNVWTNNVAAPQPRNPRHSFSSHSHSFASSLGLQTQETAFCPNSSSTLVSLRSSRASSPSTSCPPASQTTSQTLHRSFSSDRPPSPARSNPSGVRRSWADSSRRSLGFSGSGRGSFDQQNSCPTSPRSGWSSYSSSPSCLSPQAGLQSPLSPSRLSTGRGSLGGQHFTSVPWPDVRELSHKYNGSESLDTSATSTISASSPVSSLTHTLLSSPAPSDNQAAWGDPELEEGHCRSQLICAYVARPSGEQNISSSPPISNPHHNYQSPVKTQPQVQINTTISSVSSISSPLTPSSSPLPFAHSHPGKQGNQKTSYATTVNLQIAGSGRITSFSTAQVSLTQTLQGGAGAGGQGQGQMTRRVSINGLAHLPSPIQQNCDGL
nr:uncharacterized protein LOC110002689 isoform X2 [Labrus bergylta]